jgi:protein AATF/BFR2
VSTYILHVPLTLIKGFSISPSTLRKLHDDIADPKYDGVKTTRKRLLQEISESEASEIEDEDVMDSDEFDDNLREEDETFKASTANNISLETSEDHEKSPLVSQNAMSTKSARDHRASDDSTSTLQKTRDEDRRKGRAISRQIVCSTGASCKPQVDE